MILVTGATGTVGREVTQTRNPGSLKITAQNERKIVTPRTFVRARYRNLANLLATGELS